MSLGTNRNFSPPAMLNRLFLLLAGVATLYPFYNIYVYAFNKGSDSIRAPLYLFPRQCTLQNIGIAFLQEGILNSFKVSLLRTVIGTLLSVILTSSLAYAMTKRKLPGYKVFSYFFFLTFIFNGGFIPFYLTLREYKLLDSFWVLILPGAYNYWHMIIFKSFFDGIPPSIEESAQMDGASYIRILTKLIIPLSKPVFAAIALFTAIGHWNDWFSGMFYVRKASLIPLQTLLQRVMTEADMIKQLVQMGGGSTINSAWQDVTPYSIRLAIVVITVTPIIVIYPFLQKYFIKGIMIGAIKG